MTGYVYKVTSPSGKPYIGITTRDVESRFKDHVIEANRSNSQVYDNRFKQAIRKYGKENMTIETLLEKEIIDIRDLYEDEIYYIEKFDSYYNGYNMTKGGKSSWVNWFNDIDVLKNNLSECDFTDLTNKIIRYKQKICQSWVSKTQQERDEIKMKKQETWNNKSDIEKQDIIRRATFNKRQNQENNGFKSSNQLSEIINNKLPEILEKRASTINKRTNEQRKQIFNNKASSLYTVTDLRDGNVYENKLMYELNELGFNRSMISNHMCGLYKNPILKVEVIKFRTDNSFDKTKKYYKVLDLENNIVIEGSLIDISKIFDCHSSLIRSVIKNIGLGNEIKAGKLKNHKIERI